MFFDILYKALVSVAVILFSYIGYSKMSFDTSNTTYKPKYEKKSESYIPSELRWHDSFRGIENVPEKNK